MVKKLKSIGIQFAKRFVSGAEGRNAYWLIVERLSTFAVNLFITALVARHLGPEYYGLMAYVFAFSSLFTAVATLAVDEIVIRELISHPSEQRQILCTALVLKFVASIFAAGLVVLCVWLSRDGDPLLTHLSVFAGLSFFSSAVGVSRNWFAAVLESKPIAIAGISTTFTMAYLKVILVFFDGTIIGFTIVNAFGGVIGAGILSTVLFLRRKAISGIYQYSKFWAYSLITSCWPRVVSATSTSAIRDFSLILIGISVSDYALGQYNVAHRYMFAFMFFPNVIVQSLAPAVVRAKSIGGELEFLKELRRMYTILFLCGVAIGLIIATSGCIIVPLLFGIQYIDAIGYLLGLSMIFPLYAMSQGRIWYVICERAYIYSMWIVLFSSAAGIIVMYLFSKQFGIYGLIAANGSVYFYFVFLMDRLSNKHAKNSQCSTSSIAFSIKKQSS